MLDASLKPLVPVRFSSSLPSGWQKQERVHQYEQGPMQNFIYLLSCPETKKVWIVDPHKEWKKCESDFTADGYSFEGCLLTHSHHDHVAGLATLLEAYPGLPVIAGAADAFRLKTIAPKNLKLLDGDMELLLGSLRVHAIFSPGHSAGEYCYFLADESPPILLTGDVLFIRQCGRTDFATGSDQELFETLTRLKTLPDETIILPGHHYTSECASTLLIEKTTSLPLLAKSWEELRDLP